MALSFLSVDKACSILQQVFPDLLPGIHPFDEEYPIRPGFVVGFGPKDDGGYENVFADVKNLSTDQEQLFIALKGGISNTHFIKDMGTGITRVGFF